MDKDNTNPILEWAKISHTKPEVLANFQKDFPDFYHYLKHSSLVMNNTSAFMYIVLLKIFHIYKTYGKEFLFEFFTVYSYSKILSVFLVYSQDIENIAQMWVVSDKDVPMELLCDLYIKDTSKIIHTEVC